MVSWEDICQLLPRVAVRYREFLGEETKREWSWKRHTEKEWALWVRVVNFVAG